MAAEVRKKSGAWHHLRATPYQHNAYALYAAMRSNNSSSNGAVRSTMPRKGSKKRGKQQCLFLRSLHLKHHAHRPSGKKQHIGLQCSTGAHAWCFAHHHFLFCHMCSQSLLREPAQLKTYSPILMKREQSWAIVPKLPHSSHFLRKERRDWRLTFLLPGGGDTWPRFNSCFGRPRSANWC